MVGKSLHITPIIAAPEDPIYRSGKSVQPDSADCTQLIGKTQSHPKHKAPRKPMATIPKQVFRVVKSAFANGLCCAHGIISLASRP
jgi:hypothetical protein